MFPLKLIERSLKQNAAQIEKLKMRINSDPQLKKKMEKLKSMTPEERQEYIKNQLKKMKGKTSK